MNRALLCTTSALLLTLACGSSSSDGDSSANGNSSNSGAGSANSSAGSSSATGGTNGSSAGSSSAGSSSTTGGTSSAGSGTGGAGGASTGGSGTGGSGTAGTSSGGSGTAGAGGSATSGASVTQWGNDIARSSHFVAPTLTKANASKMTLDTFTAPAGNAEYIGKFAGEVAAIPLYLAGKTAGAGEYVAVTTENDVYAFNESTGALNWKTNIGAFRDAAGSCGTPAHHGIISTPVIDETTRTIYVVGGMSAANNHELHALNADTGADQKTGGFPVNLASIKATTATGTVSMMSDVQNQRSALSLVNGVIYVAFGGYCGDAGNYHGWVAGVKASDATQAGAWATVDRQAGIWAPGGMASDGNGVFAVTGNSGAMGDHTMSDSEEII
ncbi:MAG TPA: hypothetical protein VHV51_01975, partial [Polyangiaceae bacterium]|nr:hypothetical protein [Polyangiaceae bacterium]